MSRFADSTLLALTKLKTRRVRLAVTVIISSLLFCLLLALTFVVNGTIGSLQKFRSTGFSGRYIVMGVPITYANDLFGDPQLVSQAQELEKKAVAKKKAEAKRLGLEYDAASDIKYVEEFEQAPGKKTKQINPQIPELQALLAEKLKAEPGNPAKFAEQVKKFGAKSTYTSLTIGANSTSISGPSAMAYLKVIKDGKESFGDLNSGGFSGDLNNVESLSSMWQLFSQDLLKPFALQDQSMDIGKDGSIPIIGPYSAVEKMLGLKALPATATSDERLARLKQVRTKAAGHTFDICYRNSTSGEQVSQAQQMQNDIAANKSTKDYKQPDLVYALPNQACGPVRVTRDVRTAEQKKFDANQAVYDKEFGKPDADSKILRFRIVGINADVPSGGSISVTDIFQSVLTSTLGPGWASPIEVAQKQPTVSKLFGSDTPAGQVTATYSASQYAEFGSSAEMENALKNFSCEISYGGQDDPTGEKALKACKDNKKYFILSAFGTGVALDHFKKGFDKFFFIAGLIIAGVAAIILMGTVGRVITDSRRETAVFRAIGAKRLDIAQVYLTYTIILALLIALTSTVFGYLISQWIGGRYEPTVTVSALIAFNVPDLTQKFSMNTLYLKDVLYVTLMILGAAILASLLPLVANLRRNPIKDMRDER